MNEKMEVRHDIHIIPEFRVWVKEQQKYLPVTAIQYRKFKNRDNGVAIISGQEGFTTDEVELEQWTGLKDASGRKIYVGDIIEVDGSKLSIGSAENLFNMAYNRPRFNKDLQWRHPKMTVIDNIHKKSK